MAAKEQDRPRILLVEDNVPLAALLTHKLDAAGYEVLCEADGYKGLARARRDEADLLILDRDLPGLDGLEICKRVRATMDVPILMLTAAGTVPERVDGLQAGANDYLPKPFAMDELLARVEAQLRARRRVPKKRVVIADLTVDLEQHQARRGDLLLTLTPREFELLACLARNAGNVVPRDRLIETIWGYDFEGDENVLDVFIRTLRSKVERPGEPRLIHTRRGVGYVLRDEA